jgi:hypothetical protein
MTVQGIGIFLHRRRLMISSDRCTNLGETEFFEFDCHESLLASLRMSEQ